MTTFAATTADTTPDATKHVNYALGMVLGVDDFNQEFAYLSGRDRWLARDAIGYGTLNGLAVSQDSSTQKGLRITVTPGTALTPRGQLVCVSPAQCGYVNDWLTANNATVAALLGSPVNGTISLYLTLCYRDCPVDLVPIPGAPCRSEDELMAPSRRIDDFLLELRTAPPDQAEEDLLRELAAWWQQMAFGGSASIASFEAALRASVQTAGSPPSSPLPSPLTSPPGATGLHIVFGSAAAALQLDASRTTDYLRSLFRIWIEEIRPRVHAICAGGAGCCAAHDDGAPKTDECLLLARIDVPVVQSFGNFIVDKTHLTVIDESRRPMLAHLRLLQELIGGSAAEVAPLVVAPKVVAAGLVGVNTSASPTFGNLTVAFQAQNTLKLKFNGYNATRVYVVKALSNTGIDNPTIAYDSAAVDGIVLRVTRGAANVADATLRAAQFMIEISQVG